MAIDARLVYVILSLTVTCLALLIRLTRQFERMSFQHELMWNEYAEKHGLAIQQKARAANAGD